MNPLEQIQLSAGGKTGALPRPELWEPWHVVAGAVLELRGRWMIALGRLRRDDLTCALGWRLQLVGMHQRWWREDRETVEARVDTWFVRNAERLLRPTMRASARANEPLHP